MHCQAAGRQCIPLDQLCEAKRFCTHVQHLFRNLELCSVQLGCCFFFFTVAYLRILTILITLIVIIIFENIEDVLSIFCFMFHSLSFLLLWSILFWIYIYHIHPHCVPNWGAKSFSHTGYVCHFFCGFGLLAQTK